MEQFESPADIGKSPKDVVRRWLLEIQLAEKSQKDWVKQGAEIVLRYRGDKAKKNSFNILWANTETMVPAVFNSCPKPDVRRRFGDADPVGKAVCEILERALEYSIDTYDFVSSVKHDVLDMLLPGRGVSRVRYLPVFRAADVVSSAEDIQRDGIADSIVLPVRPEPVEGNLTGLSGSTGSPQTDGVGEADKSESSKQSDDANEADTPTEELDYEQVQVEHVQWDEFLHGPGRTWAEVTWVAFLHRLHRDQLIEKFGDEIGEKIGLDDTSDHDIREQDADAFKTAKVWEIWDKSAKEVVFIATSCPDEPCKTEDDPLSLQGFWPVPRPIYAIDDSSSLLPVPLFALYREQADELDRISTRINKIIDAIKVRGIYDSTLQELSTLMESGDNDLIPATNAMAFQQMGGLEKAIWFMPFQMAAEVLVSLYRQRDACKQIIYELTGISDIMRGATQAVETATAQNIKTQWGTLRLQALQREAQRYIRDLIRLKAEIIAGKFQQETLATMTGVQYPTAQDKQQAMMRYQMQLQQFHQMAQQGPPRASPQQGPSQGPSPQPPQPPNIPFTWDDIMQMLQSDMMRNFHIDIETDSTVAATLADDMQGLSQLLQSIGQTMQTFEPIVQSGMLPIEAVKQLLLSVVRRSKMGSAVEDALDNMQQPPPPPPDPSAGIQQQRLQLDQQNSQAKTQAAQVRAQAELQNTQAQAQAEQMRSQAQQQLEQAKLQGQMQLEQGRLQTHAAIEQMKVQNSAQVEQMHANMKQQTAIILGHINAKAKTDAAAAAAGFGQSFPPVPGQGNAAV